MINKLLIIRSFATVVLLLCIQIVVSRFSSHTLDTSQIKVEAQTYFDVHQAEPLFEMSLFRQSLATLADNQQVTIDSIHGAVIPHHLVGAELMSDLFYRLQQQQPSIRRVILVGPNHYETGESHIISSHYAWDTPFGLVKPDLAYILRMQDQIPAMRIDEATLKQEHSIGAIAPFISFFLPEATLVPIVVSGYTSQDEISTLSNFLSQNSDQQTVVIAAVDFSHYLFAEEAQQNDDQIWELIQNNDSDTIMTLSNDYLDSPASIVLLMQTMNSLGYVNLRLIKNTNSAHILKQPYAQTTSYFEIVY